jgi:methylated-DNA-[protein]-cysteine S-methyltransferase
LFFMPSKPLKLSKAKATQIPILAAQFPTAIGNMALAWQGEKIVGVFLPEKHEKALLALIRSRLGKKKILFSESIPTFAGHLAAQIRSHLRGVAQDFDFTHIDMPGSGPFMRKVYERTRGIPSGTVLTYAAVAKKAGSPKAFRAVGQAMAKNPFPIVIPCHRVVGSSKGAGGFSALGGLDTKARILRIETPEGTGDL